MRTFSQRLLAVIIVVFAATQGAQAHPGCGIFPSKNGSCSNELKLANNFKAYANPYSDKLSADNEQFVRSIMRSIGIENKFTEIRRLSDWEMMVMGRKNAYVSKNFTGYKMVISEDWFNELTAGERRFLTGHEAMHVRLGHCDRYLSQHSKVDMAISREQERHADLSSAVALKCAQGGIDLFTGMQHVACAMADDKDHDDPRAYRSHPELQERCQYLAPIAHDQAKGVTLNAQHALIANRVAAA